jgi:hypothetical protein
MKRFFPAVLLLTFSLLAWSHEKTRKVTVYHNGNHEVFHVLKKDKSVRHGAYTRLTIDHSKVLETGVYEHGRKTGIWKYSFRSGTGPVLEQVYDHSLNSLLFACACSDTFAREFGPFELAAGQNSPAIHIGGEENLHNLVVDGIDRAIKNRKFDDQAFLDARPDGNVVVSFTIGEDGKHLDAHVEQFLDPMVDQLVLEAVENIQTRWIPAMSDDRFIPSRKKVVIRFTYQESLNYTGSQRKMVYIDRPLGHVEKPHHYK